MRSLHVAEARAVRRKQLRTGEIGLTAATSPSVLVLFAMSHICSRSALPRPSRMTLPRSTWLPRKVERASAAVATGVCVGPAPASGRYVSMTPVMFSATPAPPSKPWTRQSARHGK